MDFPCIHKIYMKPLPDSFYDRDAQVVARELLGKVIRHHCQGLWLSAMIVETEAYYLREKGSHASLGFTEKRKALFMAPATIYMYYARGGDSLNVSCRGAGNAVLIKAGCPYCDADDATSNDASDAATQSPEQQPPAPEIESFVLRTNPALSISGTQGPGLGSKTIRSRPFFCGRGRVSPRKTDSNPPFGNPQRAR